MSEKLQSKSASRRERAGVLIASGIATAASAAGLYVAATSEQATVKTIEQNNTLLLQADPHARLQSIQPELDHATVMEIGAGVLGATAVVMFGVAAVPTFEKQD